MSILRTASPLARADRNTLVLGLVRARLTDIQCKLSEHQVLDEHSSEATVLRSLADELRDRHAEPDD